MTNRKYRFILPIRNARYAISNTRSSRRKEQHGIMAMFRKQLNMSKEFTDYSNSWENSSILLCKNMADETNMAVLGAETEDHIGG